ncbi:putative F-box domain, armadillo-like helical, leucine-rich repeat domain superfamily [Dioscorea sansibarensis]
MSRRVRRRPNSSIDVSEPRIPLYVSDDDEETHLGCVSSSADAYRNWTSLPDDTVINLSCYLNYRDRANLSSTCRSWRQLGASPWLWTSLDLRSHRCSSATATALEGRCAALRRICVRGAESAAAAIHLRARDLREIVVDGCRDITDSTLSVLAARHEFLESLQIGPEPCERVTSDAVRHVALCCSRLRCLRLSGVREIDAEAVNALSRHCPELEEIAFVDCAAVDETALQNVASLRFLSLAGTRNIKWASGALAWAKLPKLVGLDISRTDASPAAVSRLLSLSKCLKVLCVLNCVSVQEERKHCDTAFKNTKGKLLLAPFTDIFKGIASLFVDIGASQERAVFGEWRSWKKKDKDVIDIMCWLEWVLSRGLLRIAETNPAGMDEFWLRQGAALLLSLVKCSEEDVKEKAASGLATFVVIDDENAAVDPRRAEAVMGDGGIPLLLGLAQSCHECLQSEAAKFEVFSKAVADEGGIRIFAHLARSLNRLVAEEAAGGLWNLSVGEEHKATIAETGGIKALVDLIFRWPACSDGVLERAAGALANLAADDRCSMEIAVAGGVHALVMLAQSCEVEGVQEQAARALANMAAHGDNNNNNAVVGQESGALEALVQLTCSRSEGVRQEAAGALWNLSFDDGNREAIAAAGGVEALVALAQACSNASPGLQERAAGALWGLSVTEANSIAIGREGGVAPLVALARSNAEDVHETAAGALWNLAFNPGNALRIVEEGGVPALVHLCSSSRSKMARFMSALALAYMFDGRMERVALAGSSSEGASKVNLDSTRRIALKHIETFVASFSDPQLFSTVSSSSAPGSLAQIGEVARIQEAGHLRCSGAEIGRFVVMLVHPSPILRSCAAFALLQFTIPGGRHSIHHTKLLLKVGAGKVLRKSGAATLAPIEAKIYSKVVGSYLEHSEDTK